MSLIPSNLSNEIKSKFTSIRRDAYRSVVLYGTENKEDCPNCFIQGPEGYSTNVFDSSFVSPVEIFGDTITPTSFTRGRCPVCSGNGFLTQDNITSIRAIVRWNPDSKGDLELTSAGKEGSNVVSVKADKVHYKVIRDCVKAMIDGVVCELIRPPVLRNVGQTDIMTIAYLISTEVGSSVRE